VTTSENRGRKELHRKS